MGYDSADLTRELLCWHQTRITKDDKSLPKDKTASEKCSFTLSARSNFPKMMSPSRYSVICYLLASCFVLTGGFFFPVPSLSCCWLMLISKATFSLILLVLGDPYTHSSPPAYTWPNICFFRHGCITHLKHKHFHQASVSQHQSKRLHMAVTRHCPENNEIVFLLHCLISVEFFIQRIVLPLWYSYMALHHIYLVVMNGQMISVLSRAA